jgi:hypothetical protein
MASRQQLVTIVEARIRQHPTQHLVPVPGSIPAPSIKKCLQTA